VLLTLSFFRCSGHLTYELFTYLSVDYPPKYQVKNPASAGQNSKQPQSSLIFKAERLGFEPRRVFKALHALQACSFDQLGHLSGLLNQPKILKNIILSSEEYGNKSLCDFKKLNKRKKLVIKMFKNFLFNSSQKNCQKPKKHINF
jgi:hypothetical protein